jgi:hypothetical protein
MNPEYIDAYGAYGSVGADVILGKSSTRKRTYFQEVRPIEISRWGA